ncbi:methyltransferase TYW3-domain-containing protein [Cercophora scortea]|uniref:tRNA(Phe) 7-[(3-amino-3-carboxypropyl)-4-demethylwyosine(37)-N(4)]-methyltransferase n=1 Tax=Cercophora scortea TaxID=314031 RepID=A0AAE0J650_9PEZI|nr:methyltransferase TYW3-domain-containing protein [Cercophora scortea]
MKNHAAPTSGATAKSANHHQHGHQHSNETFARKKAKILSQLAVPLAEYADASPKGSVDAGIRDLIDELNEQAGLVTTSSCAGRVSVYLEGKKEKEKKEEGAASAIASAAGGKGGGEWLFVSHDPLVVAGEDEEGGRERDWASLFGVAGGEADALVERETGLVGDDGAAARLIHFKFEPMILHVLTASHSHAQRIVQAGIEAGFRETGTVSLLGRGRSNEDATPIVAVRSMGLSFESLIGVETSAHDATARRCCLVSPGYLTLLVRIANERFAENQKRIARFRAALKTAFVEEQEEDGGAGGGWEDSKARSIRKREEGLRRREEMRKKDEETAAADDRSGLDADMVLQVPESPLQDVETKQ